MRIRQGRPPTGSATAVGVFPLPLALLNQIAAHIKIQIEFLYGNCRPGNAKNGGKYHGGHNFEVA